MAKPETSSFDDLLHELNKSPEFREAYRRQAPYYKVLTQIIRRRKQLGLTQAELAKRAGTHQSNISKIESGEQDFRLSTLTAIAEALRTRVEIWLVPYYTQEEDVAVENLFSIKSSVVVETAAQNYVESPATDYESVYETAI